MTSIELLEKLKELEFTAHYNNDGDLIIKSRIPIWLKELDILENGYYLNNIKLEIKFDNIYLISSSSPIELLNFIKINKLNVIGIEQILQYQLNYLSKKIKICKSAIKYFEREFLENEDK